MWFGSSNSSASKMYKMERVRGSHRLISAWKLTPVFIAVFISISIVNCVSGEEIPFTPSNQSVISQDPIPPPPEVLLGKSNTGNALPKAVSQCGKAMYITGSVTISCTQYTTIPTDIPDSQNIQTLNMSDGNTIQRLTNGQLTRSQLPALKILILQNCQIHAIERGAFTDGGGLVNLDLSYNKIEVLDPEVFARLINLRTLQLHNNPINRFETGTMFPSLPGLTHLDLNSCVLDKISVNVLDNLTKLRNLNLYANQLKQLDWRVFRNTNLLDNVNLGNNPWHCDCHVRFLIEFFQEHSIAYQQATCFTSASIASRTSGAKWNEVPISAMTCLPKIDKIAYYVTKKSKAAHIEDAGDDASNDAEEKVEVDDDVYFECDYTGYPEPRITWRKDNVQVKESGHSNEQSVGMRTGATNISNFPETSVSATLKPKIEFKDDTLEITEKLADDDEKKTNYRFKQLLIIRRVTTEDAGKYQCIIENDGGDDSKAILLDVKYDYVMGGILPGKKVAVWIWILVGLLSILILLLICLLTCLIWRRREKRKQEGFRKVVHEKFKDSNIDLGEFEIKPVSPHSQQSKGLHRIDGATPLLDNRSESSTVLITDKSPPLPDVALGNADLIRNSQIFSPKPPPSLHGYPTDARKEFFARQISEPYLRPGSAMSLSRPAALNAAQRRYIFANQPYQSEPVTGFQENLYAVPTQVRDLPRSGSAMSVSALPEYDLRRQMFLRQNSQPYQSQYATASRIPARRIPSTSSEPPFENMPTAFSYSTLPRRPIRLQNWSRPVSPTNSTCSTYSTLSWRPNMDPRTGVISDGMGARNTAHGGSTTSINKIPDMSGSIIGGGDGIESMNRAMKTPSTPSSGGKVANARNPRYGHSRTPNSLSRGHNDFFSFEPIQEVESSECASTVNLDRAGGVQPPIGTQSLARDGKYKKKKPPPIKMFPNNLKTPSRAFDHLKGRSASPALRNNIVNGDQPKEEISTEVPNPENDSNAEVPTVQNSIVNNTNNDISNGTIPVPVLESPIDDEAQASHKSKPPGPPPPPKPKRPHLSDANVEGGPQQASEAVLNSNEDGNPNNGEGTVV